jgi:two-component sensor histidine kinase
MADPPRVHPDASRSLAMAVVAVSEAPLLLLDGDLTVIAASASFCRAFDIEPAKATNLPVYEIGAGEWDVRQFRSLLTATISGLADVNAYEMDLKRGQQAPRRLEVKARRLDLGDGEDARLLVTIVDVTDARIAKQLSDNLLREKTILLQEVQHRVANSLQIIASVLLQSARNVQSDETRLHLNDAHNRVMSIATVQRHLAASQLGEVQLRAYFGQLCDSLGASMISDRDQLSIEVMTDQSSVEADTSISLGLIVTELVINALKHAFPDGRKGKIIVAYESRSPNWTLSVSDNGVGMPKDPASAARGLGTNIVEALAGQLRARVQIAGAKPGTRVSIIHNQIAVVTDDAGQVAI